MRASNRPLAFLMSAIFVLGVAWNPSAAGFHSGWIGPIPSAATLRSVGTHPCADSYGDYSNAAYWDEELDCIVELGPGDLANVTNGIQQWENRCSAEANFLYMFDLNEWTGNYFQGGYEWEAFIKYGQYIAVHWPYFNEWWIWAHEGAHGVGYYSEYEANARADYCTQDLY